MACPFSARRPVLSQPAMRWLRSHKFRELTEWRSERPSWLSTVALLTRLPAYATRASTSAHAVSQLSKPVCGKCRGGVAILAPATFRPPGPERFRLSHAHRPSPHARGPPLVALSAGAMLRRQVSRPRSSTVGPGAHRPIGRPRGARAGRSFLVTPRPSPALLTQPDMFASMGSATPHCGGANVPSCRPRPLTAACYDDLLARVVVGVDGFETHTGDLHAIGWVPEDRRAAACEAAEKDQIAALPLRRTTLSRLHAPGVGKLEPFGQTTARVVWGPAGRWNGPTSESAARAPPRLATPVSWQIACSTDKSLNPSAERAPAGVDADMTMSGVCEVTFPGLSLSSVEVRDAP